MPEIYCLDLETLATVKFKNEAEKKFFLRLRSNPKIQNKILNEIFKFLLITFDMENEDRHHLALSTRMNIKDVLQPLIPAKCPPMERFLDTFISQSLESFVSAKSHADNDLFIQRYYAALMKAHRSFFKHLLYKDLEGELDSFATQFIIEDNIGLSKPQKTKLQEKFSKKKVELFNSISEYKELKANHDVYKYRVYSTVHGLYTFMQLLLYYLNWNMNNILFSMLPVNSKIAENIKYILFALMIELIFRVIKLNNYSDVNHLPPEFLNFLSEKYTAGINKSFIEEPVAQTTIAEMPKPKKQQHEKLSPIIEEHFIDYSQGTKLPTKPIEKSKELMPPNAVQIKQPEIQNRTTLWTVRGKHGPKNVELDPTRLSKVLPLWSCKEGFVNDTHHIWWKPKRIKAIINDENTYNHFAKIGPMAHMTSSTMHPGYVRTGSNGFKIKTKHQTFGDCRLYFKQCGETIVDGKTKTLYEPFKFKRKAH